MNKKFGFKDLQVWQRSLDLADFASSLTENLDTSHKHYRLLDQFESASSSILLNIAEGKGRYSKKEFVHFLYIARGSLYELVSMATLFNRRSWINEEQFNYLEDESYEIASMIKGLINKLEE